jgi:two-component system sensor histidine kinase BaeS
MWTKCGGNEEIRKGTGIRLFSPIPLCYGKSWRRIPTPGEAVKIRIQYKLFFAMLAVACGVVACMFLVMRWSFNRGFLKYVNKADRERLGVLAEVLEESYSREGSWKFLQDDPRRWRRLLRASLPDRFRDPFPTGSPEESAPGDAPFPPRRHGPPGARPPALSQGRMRPEPGRHFTRRVVLLDGGKKSIIAPPDLPENLPLEPLLHGGETVGYLGLLPLKMLADARQLRFVREQRQAFALIALAMVFLAALVSIPLAQRMVKRIRNLASATHRLASGRFDTRVSVESSDELGRLARNFNTLALTLEKHEQGRRQWIADISHELRTPLSVLRGEIEAMQDGVRAATPRAIGSLHGEVIRLSRLVNDLYDLSLSDLGALAYSKSDTDLAEVLRQALNLYRPDFAEKGISLEADFPPGTTFPLFADAERLHQLYSNLLGNSLKYTDPGGRLRVFVEHDDGTATVHFQDSGPGVPESDLGKLFDRLYRVDSSRNRETGGAGLGLSICRSIVEGHEGTIAALPSPLGGLWVKIAFPMNG